MSAGYGYYGFYVVKKDGSPDPKKAKDVFDWCCREYPWFVEGKPFVLEDGSHIINWNSDDWPDGLDIKHSELGNNVPGLEWLKDVSKAVKPERIVGTEHQDFSESSYDSNSYLEVVVEDGEFTHKRIFDFNSLYMGELDTSCAYLLDTDTYTHLAAKFKYKPDGSLHYFGDLQARIADLDANDDFTDAWFDENIKYDFYDCDSDCEFELLDDDGNTLIGTDCVSCSNPKFDGDIYDIIRNQDDDDYDTDPGNWEFVGLAGSPGYVALYATPAKPASPTEWPAAPEPEADSSITCAGCGTKNDPDSKFCCSCGAPLAIAQRRQDIMDRINAARADLNARLDALYGKK